MLLQNSYLEYFLIIFLAFSIAECIRFYTFALHIKIFKPTNV